MNTEVMGTNGNDPVQILLSVLTPEEINRSGIYTALLTVRSKDTDLDAAALTKLGNACLRAAKRLRFAKKGA